MPQTARYQVFISSTYRDLKSERSAVQDAILRMSHFPIGMELFPASSDGPWDLIQDVIRESDYYILIVSGKYGSTTGDGISYTEREYDFAKSLDKPILAFLHENPQQLKREQTETSEDIWNKLNAFREKAQKHHCNYWQTADELKMKVMVSLMEETRKRPMLGWIRNDGVDKDDLYRRLTDLQLRYDNINSELNRLKTESEERLQDDAILATLNDSMQITLVTRVGGRRLKNQTEGHLIVNRTLGELFMIVGPSITSPAKRSSASYSILMAIYNDLEHNKEISYSLSSQSLADIEMELLALKLITVSMHSFTPGTSSSGTQGASSVVPFWQLTEEGARILRSMRRRATTSGSVE